MKKTSKTQKPEEKMFTNKRCIQCGAALSETGTEHPDGIYCSNCSTMNPK